jgi:hypothetical protein
LCQITGPLHAFRQAEIGNVRLAVRVEQNIAGLQVAVEDAT